MKTNTVIFVLIAFFILVYPVSAAVPNCMGCHDGDQGDALQFPLIDVSLFGVHVNVNSTDGSVTPTRYDCIACHYSFVSYPHNLPRLTYTCEDCHISNISGIVPAALRVYNHNRSANSTNISVTASCGDCHNKTANLSRYNASASAAHYGRNASFGLSPGVQYCVYCHVNSSTIYGEGIMRNSSNNMVGNHTTGKIKTNHFAGNPDCITCHWTDRIHGPNLTKPVPDSLFCNNCHQLDPIQKDRHAGTVECIRCHAENNSDIHNIQYLLPNGTYRSVNATGCGNCHDFALPSPFFRLQFSTANCTLCHLGDGVAKFAEAPRFPSPMTHSSNPASGRLWNGSSPAYWDSQANACRYCHGDTLHNSNPLGNASNIQSGNALNQSITNTSFWCANCHYQSGNVSGNYSYNATSLTPRPPEIQNMSGLVPPQASDGTTFKNHSLGEYSDETCKICHAINSPITTALFVHNVTIGRIETDCISCHNEPTGTPSGIYPAINTSLFGFHMDINATDGIGNISNGDCSVCHYDISNMLVSGFTVATYTCEDCHISNISGIVPAALRVYNHNRSANSTNISVAASCGDCHNKTANLSSFNASASAAHYGRNASFGLSPGVQYCVYCHVNSSTIYGEGIMRNSSNNMVGNHTTGKIKTNHFAGNPNCITCHWTDRIHGPNLTKPVPDSGFCNNCHQLDPIQKDMHAGTVECIRCHAENNSDIHNIQYLLQNGTYQSVNATSCGDCHEFPGPTFKLGFATANCTLCHLGDGLEKFSDAPRFPSPMTHSSNPASGGLWNGSSPAYWDTQVNACKYCHGADKLHNTTPLGNVSNIQSGNALNQSITNTSFWCANCHYNATSSGNYSYNATSYAPLTLPPEIQNNSGLVPAQASDGTTFYNHSLGGYSDETCKICHSVNSPLTSAIFIHNVAAGGGGPDCISCHDSRGGGAPADKRIDIVSFNKSVHYGLNNGSNGACWACHGDGTAPSGHPEGYKSPKKCSNDECHSLYQKFRAPMVYSHFRNASLNDNPTNITNNNVTTNSDCQVCHANSVYSQGRSINSTVSHFASNDLFDSINCIYCHTNEDNSKIWGNATLIYENRTTLFELNRENNKFTAREGESVDFGFGFSLSILEISTVRETVLIELKKENITVDKSLIGKGNYTYEEYLTIDNASIKVPVIVINVTGIFKGSSTGFIQFEGFRLKRVHPEKKITSCYSCHVYASPKIKYKVIERVSNEKDEIYYTRETVNFSDKKIFDEIAILQLLDLMTNEDLHVNFQPVKQKALYEGETWNISDETSLVVMGVDSKSEVVFLQLRTGEYIYENLVNRGGIFEFTQAINYPGSQKGNITLFRAKVSGIVQARPKNRVILEDVVSLSPEIKKILSNQTLFGYNASWFWENSTIYVGKIPENFHSPQVFDGGNGGGNCLSCHGQEGFSQKKVLDLGKHASMNGGGNNACRACHGGTKDIQAHPAGYKTPRNCLSCHAATRDNYGAVYIGDEEHKNGTCKTCHVSNIHEITGLNMMPAIKKISLNTEDKVTILSALVSGGYNMKIRDARYYIDSPVEKYRMYPVDGVFDSMVEDIFAQINVSGLSPGKHVVYVEAMERNDKWGIASSIEFTIEGGTLKVPETKKTSMLTLLDTSAILLIVFVLRRLR